MVHTPVKNWAVIPDAKAKVDEEWNKLEKKKAWLLDKVREYSEVYKEAQARGRTQRSSRAVDRRRVRVRRNAFFVIRLV